MKNKKEAIDLILADLEWLNQNKKGNNIVQISQVLNHLSLLSVTLGEMVCDAYKLASEVEDDYDLGVSVRFSELTKSGTSAAAAKPIVESEFGEKRKEWTQAKANYKKLSTFLDRLDKVLEAHRQSLSIQKLEIKGI